MPDEQLMVAFRDGDYQAFETLYRRHRDRLFRYLNRQLPPAFAEDIFQDVWMRVINAKDNYQPSASFKTWLYTIANNRLKDHWRQQYRKPEDTLENKEQVIDHPTTNPDSQLEQSQMASRILALVRQLPEEQRTCFLLKEEAGLTLQQIAEITESTTEAAKSRLRYATKKLRSGLEQTYAT